MIPVLASNYLFSKHVSIDSLNLTECVDSMTPPPIPDTNKAPVGISLNVNKAAVPNSYIKCINKYISHT